MILDPIEVPIPLSSAVIVLQVTMTVHGIEVETNSNHEYAYDNWYDYSDNLHIDIIDAILPIIINIML